MSARTSVVSSASSRRCPRPAPGRAAGSSPDHGGELREPPPPSGNESILASSRLSSVGVRTLGPVTVGAHVCCRPQPRAVGEGVHQLLEIERVALGARRRSGPARPRRARRCGAALQQDHCRPVVERASGAPSSGADVPRGPRRASSTLPTRDRSGRVMRTRRAAARPARAVRRSARGTRVRPVDVLDRDDDRPLLGRGGHPLR